MQSFETEYCLYLYDGFEPVRTFNLLRLTRACHPQFTDTDSLVSIELPSALAIVPSTNERERKWRLKGESTLTVNVETGLVTIEGNVFPAALRFKIARADLHRA